MTRWLGIIILLACALMPQSALAQRRIAISFDDAPRSAGAWLTPDGRTNMLIAGMREAGVPQAAFFVNPGFLARTDGAGGEARIAAYVAAGHVIANHGFSHKRLRETAVEAYVADIDAAEAWLAERPGRRPWFRFPYLDEGSGDRAKRDAVRAALAQRGLRNGYVTIDASDWNIESLTMAAVAAGTPIDRARLRDHYVRAHVEAADFYDDLAVQTLGRSPAHMLLLHETDVAALFIADLVAALRADGWTIISADEAYADPLAQVMPDTRFAQGTLTEAMAWERGLPAPRWYRYNDVDLATARFRREVLGEEDTP
jgi:peptidoglycan-N-acetylglucosamine deacetylase